MPKLRMEIELVEGLLEAALAEDVGPGDITSNAVIPPEAVARGAFVAREAGVLAGGPLLAPLFRKLDGHVARRSAAADFRPGGAGHAAEASAPEGRSTGAVEVTLLRDDGDALAKGDAIATIRGPARAILAGERVALNILQRLSGIATLTRRFVAKAAPHGAKILDTRKTTPGWRYLEKYAVRAGGGMNHRMGLYDQVLIKDNHLLVAEKRWPGRAVAGAIEAARAAAPGGIRIEVEADTLGQVRQAIEAGADIILLDNMTDGEMRQAVALARGREPRPLLEASGGVTEARVEAIAATGVDWISVGALTHSAPALDIALDLEAPE